MFFKEKCWNFVSYQKELDFIRIRSRKLVGKKEESFSIDLIGNYVFNKGKSVR